MVEDTQNDNEQEQIEVIRIANSNQRWTPCVREETLNLLDALPLDEQSKHVLRDEALSILSRCTAPTLATGQETGLVVGYVQSGKTLSFTTVTTLARDNNFPIVIVIAGTSRHLTEQSRQRLRRDLRLDQRNDRCWRHLHNPRVNRQDHERIARLIADWHDPNVPNEQKPTMLITVMKHHGHLNHLMQALSHVDLTCIPVLIIDDEADQAGLNNLINEGDESTTYRRLRQLKDMIPHHTFLQYTATPQGPLLINLIDVLSPGFAKNLTPGQAYVGGSDFFLAEQPLVREIPTRDIPTQNNPLREPPDSLLEALRIFFLGVASGWIRDNGSGNRSMMVHPSRRTLGHQQYHTWINSICTTWLNILNNFTDPDADELLQYFRSSYNELQLTVPNIEPFEELMARMARTIRRTDIHLVNTARGPTPIIDWRGEYAHILVGGQALDRGFTVEGLTVTYMPRGVGARRADTIQQRARFFGYKQDYLGYCRVFLEPDVRDAFTTYVTHEENIRNRLCEYEDRTLAELRRAFLLPRGLAPTRDSVIDIDYVRARINEGWFYPRVPHDSRDALESNQRVVRNYLNCIERELCSDDGHNDRTQIQRHQVASGQVLSEVFEQLLVVLRFSSLSDAQNFLGIMVVLQHILSENPEETCTVYQMSNGMARVRTLNIEGEIPNLFQGAHPVEPRERRGEIYPGDREIHDDNIITIQIHALNLRSERTGPIEYEGVPNIAIWIPSRFSSDVLIQDQGGLPESDE